MSKHHKLLEIPSTISVLEGGTGTKLESFTVITIPKQADIAEGILLNQSEVAFVNELIASCTHSLEFTVKLVEAMNKDVYSMCNPEDPDALESFQQLNAYKNILSKYKNKLQKARQIARKLKKQRALMS